MAKSDKPECEIPPSSAAKHPIPTRLVLSLGIAGAVLLFLSYYAMRRYASRRRRSPPPPHVSYSSREDFADGLREPAIDHPVWYIRTIGLPQSAVDSIRRFTYKSGGGVTEAADCSVCLSEFEDGDGLRLLPKCSHAFHVACIDTWLRSHTNCPLCRAPVLDAGGGGRSNSVESASSLISDDRRSREEIEIRVEGSGGISNGSGNSNLEVIGGEMEPMRRSVSLDFSSAVSNVERKKPIWRTRSISLSGPSISV